jgi:hypothetical protein
MRFLQKPWVVSRHNRRVNQGPLEEVLQPHSQVLRVTSRLSVPIRAVARDSRVQNTCSDMLSITCRAVLHVTYAVHTSNGLIC